MLVNRVNRLNQVRGPGLLLDSACSDGLVAVHRAELSRKDESDPSITAGCNLILN
ncbi:hypothetical protein BJX66DRAFT_302407 [Aspergillus keveii]|uniref:Beta-ketoacyl synthase-like N-terminal domain-containing protein n=1 Tax=Aspergillus keveii TaxID=714993 RepID=A0ABR4G855_9EURO